MTDSMPSRRPIIPIAPVDTRLARSLWQALALCVLVLAALPASRGNLPFGSGALWLLATPLCSLLVAYRGVLAACWSDDNPGERRRSRSRVQASPARRAALVAGRERRGLRAA